MEVFNLNMKAMNVSTDLKKVEFLNIWIETILNGWPVISG